MQFIIINSYLKEIIIIFYIVNQIKQNKIRIDKFLWCVRIYKTRKLSSEACSKSKVKVNDKNIKPSYSVKVGDIIKIKKRILTVSIEVNELLKNRVPAKLLHEYINDMTPDSEKIKIQVVKSLPHAYREKGKGRPTKKERREINKSLEDYSKI